MSARSASFPPAPTAASYKDLLRFEQRLLQNAENLAVQRRKYQAFLIALVLSSLLLGYRVFLFPSIYSLVHYSYMGLLLIATTSLVLFFATGMYSEKIARAYKYVPQANKSLRPLNMHLNTKTSTYPFSWLSKDGAVRRKPSTGSNGNRSPSQASPTSDRPTSPSSRHPLQSLPPAANPRGELIFNSQVDPSFRDGYDRYRAEWERRRKEKPDPSAQSILKRRKVAKASSGAADTTPRPSLGVSSRSPPVSDDETTRGRTRSSKTSISSLQSSPASSRSPSPEFYHSRPSSGSSSAGPPSPRSLPPNDLPEVDEEYDIAGVKGPDPFAHYEEMVDGSIRLR